MDPARAAAMSDPEQNRWFRRRWADPAARPPPAGAQVGRTPVTPEEIGLELREAWRQERGRARTATVGFGVVGKRRP